MKDDRRTLRAAVVVAAACVVVALSACNTVSGVGKDLQEVSENVKDAIDK